MKYEVENLKIALEAANNALKVERQDRKTYEAMVNDAKTRDRQVYKNMVQNIKDNTGCSAKLYTLVFLNFSASKGSRNSVLDIFQ